MRSFKHHERCRVLRVFLLVLAFVAPPTLAGVTMLLCRLQGADVLDPGATNISPPAPRPPATRKPLAVIVAGNRGTEITDSLPLIELLEESEAFEVRVVAPERRLSPFKSAGVGTAGLDFYPDLSFADYAELVTDRAPALIVIPYISAWRSADAGVVSWIRAHTGPTTMVLSICQGAEIAAATGLYDGHAATAYAKGLASLQARYPSIRYRRDVRWVRDGNRMSSGSLTAGLDATLAAIDALAGRPAALRAAAAVHHPHVQFLDDPAIPTAAPSHVGIALELAFRWERTRIAIAIDDGVSESGLAALLDLYAVTMTTDAIAVSPTRTVIRTRHGLRVLPREALGSPDVIVRAEGGYDDAILQVARTHGAPMAKNVARQLNYPAEHLHLDGGVPVGLTMILRALLLGAAGLLVAVAYARRRQQNRVSGLPVRWARTANDAT